MSPRPRAVVLDGATLNPGDNPWTPLEALVELAVYDRTAPGEVAARAAGAAIVLTNKVPISAQDLAALPELQFISVLATGTNVVDTEAAAARGIPVSNVPTYGTEAVAQHTFALLLELCHHCALHGEAVRTGEWTRSADFCFWKTPQVGLAGKTLGIAGYGRIGRRVAAIGEALGMQVQFFSRHQGAGGASEAGARFVGWEAWLESSDVLTLHCALTEQSRGMIDAAALARVKPEAFLVNTSRGGLIDEAALAAALQEGRLAGAGLDVLSTEPPPAENPLLSAPRCLITPHIAWTTREARRTMMEVTAENIAAFLRGEPVHLVNG